MSSVVQDVEAALQTMQNTNPPGVSGSKIHYITELSANNVESESVIIQKLYTHFKKCPGTHKLGPLYVVDSIARRYLENAKKNNQEVSASAPDGTFAAGVYRITNLLPMLMNDILRHAPPDENKDKIEKLYQIWERSATFPPEVLSDIKTKMMASPMFQEPKEPSTPEGSPPLSARNFYQQTVQEPSKPSSVPPATPQPVSQTPSGVASMLQAIAQMAKQTNSTATPAPTTANGSNPTPPVPTSQPGVNTSGYIAPTPALNNVPVSQPSQSNGIPPMSLPYNSTSAPPNPTTTPPTHTPATVYSTVQAQQQPSTSLYPQFPGVPQQQPGQQQAPAQPTAEQLALLQLVIQQPLLANAPGVASALQGILALIQAGGAQQAPTAIPNIAVAQPQSLPQFGQVPQFWPQQPLPQQPYQQPQTTSSDTNANANTTRTYSPPPLSPRRNSRQQPYARGRSRSRSPDRFDSHDSGVRSPPSFRRRSPVYGEYEGNNDSNAASHRGGSDNKSGRGGRGGRKVSRDHTPPVGGNRVFGSPGAGGGDGYGPFPKVQRTIEWDESMGPGHIRVLSRTLFVGGVNCTENDLRTLFSQYGTVQSCIVNHEKRHAFVKMLTRDDAVRARNGMELYKTDNMTLRTRWGVGFGPRDCSDYNTGISVIPIDRLTEADQRWMVSAEYGGTGGTPLQGGMIVEEPDIEIGQGVSSKAISKRFPTDAGGQKGPHSDGRAHRGSHRGGRGGKKFGNQNAQHQHQQSQHQHSDLPHQNFPQQQQQQQQQLDPRAAQGGAETGGVAPPTPGFGAGFPFMMPGMPGMGFPPFGGAPGAS